MLIPNRLKEVLPANFVVQPLSIDGFSLIRFQFTQIVTLGMSSFPLLMGIGIGSKSNGMTLAID